MPIYEYKHLEEPCSLGEIFEVEHSIKDDALEVCPNCGRPIERLISLVNLSTPKTNSELRDLGFTKLVKRDNGVYENVTRRGNESRYFEKDKPQTMPNLKKIIKD